MVNKGGFEGDVAQKVALRHVKHHRLEVNPHEPKVNAAHRLPYMFQGPFEDLACSFLLAVFDAKLEVGFPNLNGSLAMLQRLLEHAARVHVLELGILLALLML